MTTETASLASIAGTLEALRQELARLGERVAALEKGAAPAPAPRAPAPAAPPAPPPAEPLGEELVLVIGAAVAAFLGKKAHVRQIRLIGVTNWAQQGRVTIQASHALSRSGR